MSMMKKISSMFKKKTESHEASLSIFSYFPIYQMLNNEFPFNDWKPSTIKIPNGLEELFKVSVWMVQMYVFYILTASKYGYDIADKVLGLQVAKLNTVSEELGKQLHNGVTQIQRSVTRLSENPYKMEVDKKQVEMPMEYFVAIEFLSIGESAPFPIERKAFEEGHLPEYHDADWALAECLEYGKKSCYRSF